MREFPSKNALFLSLCFRKCTVSSTLLVHPDPNSLHGKRILEWSLVSDATIGGQLFKISWRYLFLKLFDIFLKLKKKKKKKNSQHSLLFLKVHGFWRSNEGECCWKRWRGILFDVDSGILGKNPSAPVCRSRTYDLSITSSDATGDVWELGLGDTREKSECFFAGVEATTFRLLVRVL